MDTAWLKGIGVDESDKNMAELVAAIDSELELLVGDAIAKELSDEQIDAFETLMDESDEKLDEEQ